MQTQPQIRPGAPASVDSLEPAAAPQRESLGNRAVHEDIVRRHGTRLYKQALRLTGNHQDALDLVQDTFEASLRKLPPALPEARVGFWLAAILHNRFIDLRRSLPCRGRSTGVEAADAALCTLEQGEEPRWTTVDPRRLQPLTQRLKPVFRDVFQLRTYEQLSYGAIADRLGIPISTVGSRYHRALLNLRQALAGDAS